MEVRYLAGQGLAERLPVGAERGPRVVAQQVLQPRVGAVLAQHHVAAVPELGQQEVAAASAAPGGPSGDQACSPTPPTLPAPRQGVPPQQWDGEELKEGLTQPRPHL